MSTPIEKPKVRHEHFQSDTFITLSVYIKNLDPSTVSLNLFPNALSLSIAYPITNTSYSLELDLWGEIIPAESTHSVLKTQVEIKLKKKVAGHWPKLEADDEVKVVAQPVEVFSIFYIRIMNM